MVNIGNIINVGGTSTGTSGGGSGITTINPGGNQGPTVEFKGVNGIDVSSPSNNCILIDGIDLSGVQSTASGLNCFTDNFTSITSGQFTHNLGTRNLVVQVIDNSAPPQFILPDAIIYDNLNIFSLLFNRPQTGTVVAVACGGSSGGSSTVKFSESFMNVTSVTVTHNLGTEDVLVQVRDDDSPPQQIIPDKILYDNTNEITLEFNTSRSGRVTVIA